MKLNLRRHAAGVLMPAFLRGHLSSWVPSAWVDGVHKLAYTLRVSRWLREHPLEPAFPERLELYAHLLRTEALDGPIDYLEFGVATGRSIRWWTEHIQHPRARFVGFDTFTGLPEDWGDIPRGTFDQGGRTPNLADPRVMWQVGLFQETLPGFLAQFDASRRKVIHLDADLFSSTLYVLTRLAPCLRAGDVLIFDEFTRMTDATHEFRAFEDYCQAYGVDFDVLGAAGGYVQVALRLR